MRGQVQLGYDLVGGHHYVSHIPLAGTQSTMELSICLTGSSAVHSSPETG
ncbi:hypothetical protein RAZWK3B_13564 [Roseobacter sp. AzwK-3b]|nr:hypothetical protein RAZWK3B_13564 [Roseobacter sp. AzwK-3b]